MPRYNRHTNPAFGVSTDGWTQSGTKAAIARNGGGTFERPGGGVGWLADARSNGSSRPAFWTTGSLGGLTPVVESETYTVSIYAYQGSGATRNQRLDVDMVNASGSVVRSVAATVAGANNVWHRLSASVTVQPGETHISTYLAFLVGGATPVDNTYVAATQAMIEDSAVLGDYRDGDYEGWQWNGTPGLSMSQEIPEPEPEPTSFGSGFLALLLTE
jgi:hypothetical protein